ncbi:MAG: aminomethyl-transferring glycine dehydrogenase [Ilumatobacteraceae bacterium]
MSLHDELHQLSDDGDFVGRHIGPTDGDAAAMLRAVGAPSIGALIDETVPDPIRLRSALDLPGPRSVDDVMAELRGLAARNRRRTSLIGQGYYGTHTPPVIRRNMLENPAWYTAYTPYQPEISQGRLESLLNFQTMIADLTGLPLANASMLDEATAAAEAMTMARRISAHAVDRFVVDRDTHPQTINVLRTRAEPIGIEVVVADLLADPSPVGNAFGVLVSLPTSTGALAEWSAVIATARAAGAVVVMATDLLACVATTPPGELGADIALGSAQRFGVPMGFGGPHAAFLATRDEHARALPGRLVGVSADAAGRPALRLALQTREQHIRREKATSNICTAQVLLANMAAMFAVWHGPDGLRRIATRVHRLTSLVAASLRHAGIDVAHDTWFDTLCVRVDAEAVVSTARSAGLDLRVVDRSTVALSIDETTTLDTVRRLLEVFGADDSLDGLLDGAPEQVPSGLVRRRTSAFLEHPVFHRYHSEHEMLRYLRRLSDADLALDRTMIPLGSCTMKLNAVAEMEAVTWPDFADLHPYAPDDETEGTRALIADLERQLVAITGYDAVSLQPNAGSQGEFAGLLAIRAYHRSRGEHQRAVCLIPSSAHGTNAASAVMAGLDVVVVACDERGNVDVADLRAKAAAAGDRLAAAMITYPSTHGVFEEAVTEICAIVHEHGGQVYVDGANLNALVGLARPGSFGADVSHLNLHKTFCIPHGGGGPGVGPVAVRAHLAPFLPGNPLSPGDGVGPVSAARFGSAGILPISWVYIALMGADGLRRATEHAILSANYVAARLGAAYPVLYTGAAGRVAHECIIDIRPLTKTTGVTVDDIAKRLVDHGFHAPTVSFPVAGTLMIEPTESETLAELDRFCDAMLSIRDEIADVEQGRTSIEQSPLRGAPHTTADLVGEWTRSYPRDVGAHPSGLHRSRTYFPPVSRIDAAYGDRHLVCSCPPVESFATA